MIDAAVRSVYRAIWNSDYDVDVSLKGRTAAHALAEQMAGALAKDGLLAAAAAQPVVMPQSASEGHTGKRVRYEYQGDTWDGWLVTVTPTANGTQATVKRDNGENWVVMARNCTPIASPAAPTEHCPRCDSPDPAKHPAVQFEGEVSICPDRWHSPAAPADDEATPGVALIATERRRQVETEGYDAEHDAGHLPKAFVDAAISYATPPGERRMAGGAPYTWPWGDEDWKPCPDDRVRELVKAGALIAAAIDAIQARAALAALKEGRHA